MNKMRLDKLLANSGFGSRKTVKNTIKSGQVVVSSKVITDPSIIIDIDKETVFINDQRVNYKEFYYLMMNKPVGIISATWDKKDKTVIDILPDFYKPFNLFPVGRLDKDTEGLLLLTNDGKLAHNLLSPKKRVAKKYFAIINGRATNDDIKLFDQGLKLEEGFTTLPAKLEILSVSIQSKVYVTIYEGKFHQIKRMFKAVDKEVLYLKRIAMGNLYLDDNIPLGNARELTKEELSILNREI